MSLEELKKLESDLKKFKAYLKSKQVRLAPSLPQIDNALTVVRFEIDSHNLKGPNTDLISL